MKCIPRLVINNLLKHLRYEVNIETGRSFSLSASIPCLKTGEKRACFHSEGNARFIIQKLINLVTSSVRTGDPKC